MFAEKNTLLHVLSLALHVRREKYIVLCIY